MLFKRFLKNVILKMHKIGKNWQKLAKINQKLNFSISLKNSHFFSLFALNCLLCLSRPEKRKNSRKTTTTTINDLTVKKILKKIQLKIFTHFGSPCALVVACAQLQTAAC
jgi:hypothetical protein